MSVFYLILFFIALFAFFPPTGYCRSLFRYSGSFFLEINVYLSSGFIIKINKKHNIQAVIGVQRWFNNLINVVILLYSQGLNINLFGAQLSVFVSYDSPRLDFSLSTLKMVSKL